MPAGQHADEETRLQGVMHAVCFRFGSQAADQLLSDFGFQGFDRDSRVTAKNTIPLCSAVLNGT